MPVSVWPTVSSGARDPEIGHLGVAVVVQQHVLRLHVAVNEALAVSERKCSADLEPELQRAAHGQRPAALDELLEVLALDDLEDDELLPILVTAVDDGDDVRVRELGDRASLSPEALDVLLVLAVLVVEHLQRDVAFEQRVECAVDARHPAGSEDVLELVPARNGLLPHHHQTTVPTASKTELGEHVLRARLPTPRVLRPARNL